MWSLRRLLSRTLKEIKAELNHAHAKVKRADNGEHDTLTHPGHGPTMAYRVDASKALTQTILMSGTQALSDTIYRHSWSGMMSTITHLSYITQPTHSHIHGSALLEFCPLKDVQPMCGTVMHSLLTVVKCHLSANIAKTLIYTWCAYEKVAPGAYDDTPSIIQDSLLTR
jgi:hypothetical protein